MRLVRGVMRFRSFRSSRAVSAAAALAITALSAGCAPASAGPDAAPEKPNIVVEDFPTIDSAGLYIAQMDGLFQQQGLNVTIRFAPASQLAVSSQLNGTSDISSADYVTYIDDELNENAHLRIIGEASSLEPHELSMFVGPHSGIRSLTGLEDHTVAVTAPGDISTLLVRALLAENGVRSRFVNIQPGFPLQNMAQELDSGLASAAPIPEPFASEGEQQYGLQELTDVDQGATTNFPLDGYAVTQAWARKYPNTLAAFLRALRQGQEIADTNRSAVETALEKFLSISPETASVIALPDYPLSVDPTQLQRVVDAMVQFSLLPRRDTSFKITRMTG
jgi:NitT/TauT family transport system substrate-binding protein